MAKISIMKVLKSRKKIRFYTILACCLVFAFGVWQVVINNPFKTRAATDLLITKSGFIYDNQYCVGIANSSAARVQDDNGVVTTSCTAGWSTIAPDGNVTIDGKDVTVVMWGTFTASNLTLQNGAKITHAPLVYHSSSTQYTHLDSHTAYEWYSDVRYYLDKNGEKDFSSDTGAISDGSTVGLDPKAKVDFPLGLKKKIDLQISGTLSVLNGSSIDADGMGYPGGKGQNGYNYESTGVNEGSSSTNINDPINGAGMPTNYGPAVAATSNADRFSSGAGAGGWSQAGGVSYVKNGDDGQTYQIAGGLSRSSSGLNYGFGGGSVKPNTGDFGNALNGGSGGGYINITASDLVISKNSKISANGLYGRSSNSQYAGGGGGGGTILINADKVEVVANTSAPDVSGGDWLPSLYDDSGQVPNMTHSPGKNGLPGTVDLVAGQTYQDGVGSIGNVLKAQGAGGGHGGSICPNNVGTIHCAGGGGSGGYIKVRDKVGSASPTVVGICTITPDMAVSGVSSIPAYCNSGRDVVIDGLGQTLPDDYLTNVTTAKVYADRIQVWQPVTAGIQPAAKPVGGLCTNETNTNNVDQLCDSKRSFASLTIKNNGILTHQSVTIAEMAKASNNSLASATTGTGRWKKVDIETAGDITLASGGMINADVKGYPGGHGAYNYTTGGIGGHTDGYGPGFSVGTTATGEDETGAGGASYIGAGGSGKTTAGGATYSNIFDFGSGSGAVYLNGGGTVYDGIAGGGRIRLKSLGSLQMDATTSISANGGNGTAYASESTFVSNHYAVTGGGSGGSINIIVAKLHTIDTSLNLSVNHGAGGLGGHHHDSAGTGGNGGDVGRVDSDINAEATGQIDGSNKTLISAAGGSSESWSDSYGGNGGGGRIVLAKFTQNGVTIRKTLEAVSRNGAPVATTPFNPYALQKNDKILVKLELTNLTVGQQTTITDDYLKTPDGSAACSKLPTIVQDTIPSTGVSGVSSAIWKFTPTSDSQILSYQCTVQ